jgi:hypothetical protein
VEFVRRGKARAKLGKWADDRMLLAEKALADTKEQLKAPRRQARQAVAQPKLPLLMMLSEMTHQDEWIAKPFLLA